MLLDLTADGVAVLIGHDHVGDYHVGAILLELCRVRGRVGAGNHVDILAAKGDLDDFAHGGTVINEVDGRRPLGGSLVQRRNGHGFTHSASLSAMSRVPSSNSRMASSIRSVAERSTVRWVDVVP